MAINLAAQAGVRVKKTESIYTKKQIDGFKIFVITVK